MYLYMPMELALITFLLVGLGKISFLAEALLHDEDEALRILAREEFPALKAAVERKREALQILLLPRDPADEKDVIIEVRAGVGGEEAALFAHSLCRMYSMYADAKGWSVQMANMNQTELGGVKEAVFSISGQGAYSRLKYESGVHRVQRVPETESGGRIHTSTATVAVLPQVDEVEFELDMNEVRIDTFRSSGAGGQHINKTESAIRVTHIPTNTVVYLVFLQVFFYFCVKNRTYFYQFLTCILSFVIV